MVAQLLPQPHPILAAVDQAARTLCAGGARRPAGVHDPGRERPRSPRVARLEAMTAELKLRVVAAAEDAARRGRCPRHRRLVASVTRADFPAGRAQGRLAEALDRRWTRVAAGMADGVVSAAQASVVVDVPSTTCPTTSTPSCWRRPRPRWSPCAPSSGPASCAASAGTSCEVVAPEIAEAEEAKRLENEEQRAREKTSLRSRIIGDGLARTTIVHPDPRPGPAADLPGVLHLTPQAPRRDQR